MKKVLFFLGIWLIFTYPVHLHAQSKIFINRKNAKMDKIILEIERDVSPLLLYAQEPALQIEEAIHQNGGNIPNDLFFIVLVEIALEINTHVEETLLEYEEIFIDLEEGGKIHLSEQVVNDLERTRALLDALVEYLKVQHELYENYLSKDEKKFRG